MKRILIIEDEIPSSRRLEKLLKSLSGEINIIAKLDSIEDSVKWFKENEEPDLAFFDIQLADGLSFSIFDQVNIECPIVFTTAFDQYAIKAFKVNSIDYLLKPINPEELKVAWEKFQKTGNDNLKLEKIVSAFNSINQRKNFKERFLIKKGDQYLYINHDEVAYFFSESSLTFLVDKHGGKCIFDENLDALQDKLDPHHFYRINRKFIINESAIKKISNYFNGRLKLELNPHSEQEVIVARERVVDFKNWLNS